MKHRKFDFFDDLWELKLLIMSFLFYLVLTIVCLVREQAAEKELPIEPTNTVTVKEIQEQEPEKSGMEEGDEIPGVDVDKPAMVARYSDISMTEEEKRELAAVVYLEAGNQTDEGQQAVAEVILNRVISEYFPWTVHDVLHQGEGTAVPQFSTVYGIATAEPNQAAYDAIDVALYGNSILPDEVVYFSRSGENDRVWGKIGGHVFCYGYEW